ncbi:hypothetical protein NDU88_001906 [Pleurodeles waltl]|uniref:Uncharacterized protein n=1 Tax=Pleurodeles waltl TaxID=8319 RepID=A0AAV7TJ37_PLEWA|nr:hypothetical protein NDU88_001906 [Pleurodeles waltl]
MPKMAPDPLGPAAAPRAPGVARRSPCSARVADAPLSLRTRAEWAGAGRARRELGWSREGSSPCPSPHPARALGARPRPSSTPRGTLGPRQTLRTPPIGPPPRPCHQICGGRPTGCLGRAVDGALVRAVELPGRIGPERCGARAAWCAEQEQSGSRGWVQAGAVLTQTTMTYR